MINESFDGMDTPGKKRKRENWSKFTSSTPIKINNKENCLFTDTLCMEVKSIAELVAAERQKKIPSVSDYEVVRKPPKKKKKPSTEECCFTNKALDLKVENEKVINPYEVVRDVEEGTKGIANPALEIIECGKLPSKVGTNPFEVARESTAAAAAPVVCGFDNVACELNAPQLPPRTALVLPLPFTPTVNHRIDFSNMPDMTPSTLLSTKLILENNEAKIIAATPTAKLFKSLSIISEEENDLDIGEELDKYQLQIENSINEAKMKNKTEDEPNVVSVKNETYTKEKIIEESAKESTPKEEFDFEDSTDGIQFQEVDSFDEIHKLGQFKRAYRRDTCVSNEQIANAPKTSSENVHEKKTSNRITKTIRRSIRKLIHPNNHATNNNSNEDNDQNSAEKEKHEGIFHTIRQSLRRKQKPKIMQVSLETSVVGRQVFREKSNEEDGKGRTLERQTLKRNVIKTMKTFMESVEEFDHY